MAERALATAFVNIVPGTKALEQYLKGDLLNAAKTAGGDSGDEFSKNFDKKLKDLGYAESKKAGKKAGEGFGNSFGSSVKKLIGPAIAAVGVAAVGNFVGDTVNAAKQLNIESLGVDQVFGEASGIVQEFGKNAAKTAGLTAASALGAAKGFGVIATSAGLAGESAANFSTSLVQTAGDLASFNGGTAEEALSAIQSAMQGQYEPLRRYSLFLDENTLKQAAFAAGITDSVSTALTPQQKALATQAYLMENLGAATGDFQNYGDSFDNALMTMQAELKNTQAEIGMALLPALGDVVNAMNPIIEEAAPMMAQVFEAIIPIIELAADVISQLLPIIEPLIDVFGSLIDTTLIILDAVMPPLITIFQALMPVIAELAGLFNVIVESVLPPLIKLIEEVLLPVFIGLIDGIATYGIPIIERLVELFGGVLTVAIDAVASAFKWLQEKLAPVWEAIKPFLEGFMSLMGIKPVKLSVTTSYKTKGKPVDTTSIAGITKASGKTVGKFQAGVVDYSGATGIKTGSTGAAAAKTAKAADKAIKKLVADVEKKTAKARKSYQKAVDKAYETYSKSVIKANSEFDAKVIELTAKRDENLTKLDAEHAQNVIDINREFTDKMADIVQQSKDRLRSAFESVAAVDVGSVFAEMGTRNADALIRNLKERLGKAKKLVESAGALASAGFSQTFIEQLVAQGPDAGNAMAKAVLDATPESQKELQALFSESETFASHGMDSLADTMYEKSGLATEALRSLYTEAQSDLVLALEQEQTIYATKQAEIQAAFDEGMLQAAATRDAAIIEAENELNSALTTALATLNDTLDTVQKDFNDKLKEFKDQLGNHAAEIRKIKDEITAARAAAMAPISYTATGAMPKLASGGFVTKPTTALIGEAGPEVVTPLADFERMLGLNDNRSGQTIIYNAAPNKSLDAEADLFTAMQRARVFA